MRRSPRRWGSEVNILLDTHIAIWAVSDAPALSATARNIILDSRNEIFVSDISAWEIAVKSVAKPGSIPFGAAAFIDGCNVSGYRFLPIDHEAIVAYEGLDYETVGGAHKDPFDRLLIAQSKSSNMLFLTHDEILKQYEEPLVTIV